MNKTKIFTFFFSLIVSIALILLGMTIYFGKGMDLISKCDEELIQKSNSPGEFVANTYVRNCGATTDYVTHINLAKKYQELKPNSQGIIKEGEVVSITGKTEVSIQWNSSTELELKIPDYKSRDVRASKFWESVHIVVK